MAAVVREIEDVASHTENALHPSATDMRKMSIANHELPTLLEESKAATAAEHRMSIMQAIRTYPKAVAFSMILSTAIVMEGYDVVLLANFYAVRIPCSTSLSFGKGPSETFLTRRV